MTSLEELDIRAYGDLLREADVLCERAGAEYRRYRDHRVQLWYQTLTDYLRQPGTGDVRKIHLVLDSMDQALNRSRK